MKSRRGSYVALHVKCHVSLKSSCRLIIKRSVYVYMRISKYENVTAVVSRDISIFNSSALGNRESETKKEKDREMGEGEECAVISLIPPMQISQRK